VGTKSKPVTLTLVLDLGIQNLNLGFIFGMVCLFVCLFVYSRLSNFSAIRRLSPLPVTGLQI
jgi:hypothetical protein